MTSTREAPTRLATRTARSHTESPATLTWDSGLSAITMASSEGGPTSQRLHVLSHARQDLAPPTVRFRHAPHRVAEFGRSLGACGCRLVKVEHLGRATH